MGARQWSRIAWALALLFGSLPVAGRLVLGTWEFVEAAEISCLLLLLGTWMHLRSRRQYAMPDPATLLEQASHFAATGREDRAIGLLTKTIRQSPKLWQAYQYRGELHLRLEDAALAARDFTQAIRLAPNEAHLYLLLEQAHRLLGLDADGPAADLS